MRSVRHRVPCRQASRCVAASETELSRDVEVFFLTHGLVKAVPDSQTFGCSSLTVKNQVGETLSGRNFDWPDLATTTAICSPSA